MATVNSDRYGQATYTPDEGEMAVAYGSYEGAGALSTNDVINWFDLPKSAIVMIGYLRGPDVDDGTEAFELDIGISSDTDYYLNSGVISGDAAAPHKAAVGVFAWMEGLWYTTGEGLHSPLSASETVIGTVVAAANSNAGLGALSLVFHYTVQYS